MFGDLAMAGADLEGSFYSWLMSGQRGTEY